MKIKRWILGFYFLGFAVLQPVMAESANMTTADVGYNYNAACLFIDFMQEKIPKITTSILHDTVHLKKIVKNNNESPEYEFKKDGVTLHLIENQTGLVQTNTKFQSSMVSKNMRTRKYLIGILQITNSSVSNQSLKIECDATNLQFNFVKDTLSTIEISPSFVD